MEAGRKSPELANLLTSLYGDDDPRQAVEMGREVEEMVNHPGWAVIEQLVTTLRQRGLDQLMQGSRPLDSKAEYAQRLGFLNGIGVSLDAARSVIDRGTRELRRLEANAARQAAGS
jgi:hypothetical protein